MFFFYEELCFFNDEFYDLFFAWKQFMFVFMIFLFLMFFGFNEIFIF